MIKEPYSYPSQLFNPYIYASDPPPRGSSTIPLRSLCVLYKVRDGLNGSMAVTGVITSNNIVQCFYISH
jgi:hypothetical protein